MLDHIFARYDAVLVLDTETTGISCRKDEIIELAVLKAGQDEAGLCELETMDEFIRLSEGRHLPEKIVELTGITERMLLDDGISKRQAAEMFSRMFGERTLIVAYNAQFDLCFLYYFLAQFGMAALSLGMMIWTSGCFVKIMINSLRFGGCAPGREDVRCAHGLQGPPSVSA